MNLADLALFTDVAHRLSFSAAAEALNTDPTTVSRRIAQLEAELGARLFHRTTRRMSLTEAGAQFFDDATRILADLDESREGLRGLTASPRGTLRLTASVAFGEVVLVPLLSEIRACCPDLAIDLLLTDSTLDIVAEGIDLAIRLGPLPSGAGVATRLMTTRYRVCASASWITVHGQPREPAELAQIDCLRFALPGLRHHWVFRDTTRQIQKVRVSGPVAISSALALRSAARDGLGPALLADWMVAGDLASGALNDLFPDHDVTATGFDTAAWAIYPERAFLPRKTRAVLDLLKAHLA